MSARPKVEIGELAFCHFAHPTLSHGLPDNVIMSCHCHKDNIIFLMKSPEGEVDPIGGDLVSPSCPPTSPDLPSASLMCQLLVVLYCQKYFDLQGNVEDNLPPNVGLKHKLKWLLCARPAKSILLQIILSHMTFDIIFGVHKQLKVVKSSE